MPPSVLLYLKVLSSCETPLHFYIPILVFVLLCATLKYKETEYIRAQLIYRNLLLCN
jgi:hypothetical protein